MSELITSRNETAGFVEFINSDVPVIVRDLDAPAAILIDLNTRQVVGYRVYDPAPTAATLTSQAARIAELEAQLAAANGKRERQAIEIQRMARKIRAQRKMARDTWTIIERRSAWVRRPLFYNRFLQASVDAFKRTRAAEARLAKAVETLELARNQLARATVEGQP